MLPISVQTKGFTYERNLYTGVTSAVVNSFNTSRVVTCSSLVKGDKHRPNPWSYTVREVNYLRGNNLWRITSPGYLGGTDANGCIAFDSAHQMFNDVTFPSDLYNAALSSLNEKTRGTLDLSIDLAQAGMNIRMMNVIGRIREYTHTPGWRALISGASSARLEYVYGWRPLADSLYGVLDESQRLVTNEIERFRVRKSRPVSSYKANVNVKFYGGVPTNMVRSGRHMCEISVMLKTRDFDLSRWASLNPISWAYELTPYSFVLDWMIDVGGYIRNLETSLLYGNSFVSGYRTQVTAFDVEGLADATRVQSGNPSYLYSVLGSCSGRYINFNRSILTSYPLPRLPTFRADLGSQRLLNLAALLGQRMKR